MPLKDVLFLDEELEIREIPNDPKEELPHTFKK
jgi:hypothetical protein